MDIDPQKKGNITNNNLNSESNQEKTNLELEDIVEKLINLGLTKNDALIYLTLIRYGECSPSEVADYSGVDRSRVYDSLKRLGKKGFVQKLFIGGSSKYNAIAPEHVFSKIRTMYIQKLKELNWITEIIKSLPKERIQKNVVWIVKDKDDIRNLIFKIIDEAEDVIYLILTDDLFNDNNFMLRLKGKIVQKKLYKDQIKIKISMGVSMKIKINRQQNPMKEIINTLYHSGVEIFHFPQSIPPFGIALNEKMFLQTYTTRMNPSPAYEFGIKVERITPAQLNGFKYLCDFIFTSICKRVVVTKRNS